MTKETEIEVLSIPEVHLEAKLTTEDIVSIGVSERTDTINARREELIPEKTKLEKEYNEANALYAKYIEKEITLSKEDADRLITKTLEKFRKLYPECTLQNRDFLVLTNLQDGIYVITLHNVLFATLPIPAAKIKQAEKLMERAKALKVQIDGINEQLLTLAAHLRNMPDFARKCRAEIAKAKLANSAQGKKLIQNLLNLSETKLLK